MLANGGCFSVGGIDANISEIWAAGQCCRRGSGDCWRSWTDCKSTMPYCCQNPNSSHLGMEQIEFVTRVNPRRQSLFPTQNQKGFSWSKEYPVSSKYIFKSCKKNFWESWTDLNKRLSGSVKVHRGDPNEGNGSCSLEALPTWCWVLFFT